MSEAAWSWKDYEKQFGSRPNRRASPAASPASGEVGGVSGACSASSCGENRAHDGQSQVPGGQPTEPELRRDSLERQPEGVSAGGGLPANPPSGGNCPGENPAPLGLINAYQVVLSAALHEGLRPFAEKRGVTVGALAINLLEIEVEGGLIDLTLDGEGEP